MHTGYKYRIVGPRNVTVLSIIKEPMQQIFSFCSYTQDGKLWFCWVNGWTQIIFV